VIDLSSILFVFNVSINHGDHWGDIRQALTRWWHSVASSEAQDVLHWAMRPASYCRIRMAIKITSTFPAFSLSLIPLLPNPVDKANVVVKINYNQVIMLLL
jgi:hypothetical protein